MNQPAMIEARAFVIARCWAHNFWVLRGPQGQWLGELHGLATDRHDGHPVPVGYRRRHSLRGWHFDAGQRLTLCRAGQPVRPMYQGMDALERWQCAAGLIDAINALDLPYPRGGLRLWGATVNSNSVFTTFARAMGLAAPRFAGLLQPGLGRCVI